MKRYTLPNSPRAITSRTPPSTCPSCMATLDARTGIDARPKPGDASICIECKTLLIFDENLRLRRPTEEEIIQVRKVPEYRFMLDALKKKTA